MIFCKLLQKNIKHPLWAPENNIESTSNQSSTVLKLIVACLFCYSCCYFISIPIAIYYGHRCCWAAQSNKIATTYSCRWEMMIRSLPPWPQHCTAPIKRSYSYLPMDIIKSRGCGFVGLQMKSTVWQHPMSSSDEVIIFGLLPFRKPAVEPAVENDIPDRAR